MLVKERKTLCVLTPFASVALYTTNSQRILEPAVYSWHHLHQHCQPKKTNPPHISSRNISLTFAPEFMSGLTSPLWGQMLSPRQGNKTVTPSDSVQPHALCLSLSSICINLTFSNLPLPISSSQQTCCSLLVWMSSESMHKESGGYYGSPWMNFPLIGDRHAALKHGLLCLGDRGLLFLIGDF